MFLSLIQRFFFFICFPRYCKTLGFYSKDLQRKFPHRVSNKLCYLDVANRSKTHVLGKKSTLQNGINSKIIILIDMCDAFRYKLTFGQNLRDSEIWLYPDLWISIVTNFNKSKINYTHKNELFVFINFIWMTLCHSLDSLLMFEGFEIT